jgi:uncharacterized protein involved in exopolysaccharide biosynthesis
MQENNYSLVGIINTLLRWKKQIITLIVLSSIAGVIVSFVLPVKYKSVAIFYPVNPALTDRQMLFNEKGTDQYIDYFGSKNDINRMLSIAYSANVIDYLINTYKLHQHYDIDTTDKLWRWKTREELLDNYEAKKSELGAVEITVTDEDKFLAAEIANKVVQLIDKQSKDIIIANKQKILSLYKTKLDDKANEVNNAADNLADMRVKYSIKELESPDGGILLVKGSDPNAVEQFKILLRRQMNAIKDLNVITTIYEQHSATIKDEVSAVYIVENAYPAEKKSSPIRWLICVSAFLGALFFGIVGVLITERISSISKQVQANA